MLYTHYLIPFEIASMLLLVAVDVEPRTRAEDLALDDFVRITDALLAAGVVAA